MLFFSEREYGGGVFLQCYAAMTHIPEDQRTRKLARWLDVSERTIRRWLHGSGSPPRAVVYAMWHECNIGRDYMRAHNKFEYTNFSSRCASLESRNANQAAEIKRLETILSYWGGSSNDSFIPNHERSQPRRSACVA
jgi:hypothetical protein